MDQTGTAPASCLDMVGGGAGVGVAGRSMWPTAPRTLGAVIRERGRWMEPEDLLPRPCGCSFSKNAVTSVASRSMVTRPQSAPGSNARGRIQGRSRRPRDQPRSYVAHRCERYDGNGRPGRKAKDRTRRTSPRHPPSHSTEAPGSDQTLLANSRQALKYRRYRARSPRHGLTLRVIHGGRPPDNEMY